VAAGLGLGLPALSIIGGLLLVATVHRALRAAR
jgi:hypothetical protein